MNLLDVESDRRNGSDDLSKLELVKDGGLSGGVQPNHQDPHILLPEQGREDFAQGETHCCGCSKGGGRGVRGVLATPARKMAAGDGRLRSGSARWQGARLAAKVGVLGVVPAIADSALFDER